MANPEHKAHLANFLSKQLMLKILANKTVVVTCGFVDEEQVESLDPEVDTDKVKARQEEALNPPS